MEHLFKIAFWIFVLSGCHLTSSKSIQTDDDDDWVFEELQNDAKCPPDLKLYTPTYKGGWAKDILECIQKEINGTVKEECEDPNGRIDQVISVLKNVPSDNGNGQNTKKHTCEKSPVKSFQEFVTSVKDILQKIRSHRDLTQN